MNVLGMQFKQLFFLAQEVTDSVTFNLFPGIFEGYYGGSVYQGSNNNNGFLYHVLRIQGTEADVIVAVNPNTCEVRYSDVTNLRHVHSLQKVSQEM